MKRHPGQGNSYKRKHLIGGLLTILEGSSMIIMAGGKQTDMETEQYLRTSHPDQISRHQAERERLGFTGLLKFQCLLPVIQLLQQDHAYSNKATPTPTRPRLLILLRVVHLGTKHSNTRAYGAILTQTITSFVRSKSAIDP